MKKLFITLMIVVAMLLCSCASLQITPQTMHFKTILLSSIKPTVCGKYQAQTTFPQNTVAWLYLEIAGFEVREINGLRYVWHRCELVMRDMSGNEDRYVLFDDEFALNPDMELDKIYLGQPLFMRALKVGDYELTIIMTDKYTDIMVHKTLRFTVMSATKRA